MDYAENLNPNRDKLGQFSTGGLSSSKKAMIASSIIKHYNKPTSEKHKIFQEALTTANIKDNKLTKVQKYSPDSTMLYKATNNSDPLAVTSWSEFKTFNGDTMIETNSGIYFSKDKSYAAQFDGKMHEFGLKKSAKILDKNNDFGKQKQKIIKDFVNNYTKDFSEKVMVEDILSKDEGIVAVLGGLDGYMRGSQETVIVNKSVIEIQNIKNAIQYIETLDGKVLIINAGKGNPNRALDGRFTYGPGGSEGSSLTELYAEYPAMEKTLDKMDAVNATFKQSELDRLKKIRNISDKKESTASSAIRAREAELDKQGKLYDKGGNDAANKDAEYRRLDSIYQKASKESSKAFNKWQDYKLNKERTKTKLKEDLYESTYGEDWKDKYNTAHETLREWARNEYGKSKKKMAGENYGSLELEHALTQAHYLRNGQKEVEVYWGLYGKAAEGVISGKGNIRKDITSVTNSKEIAESYARMSRMTSGTKRHITNRSSAFPLNGVIVTAKIPVNKIIVSHEISANTWHRIYDDFKMREVSPGAFLQDQLELIIDVPSKADTSNYKIIPTHSSAIELREAIMSGKTWSEVI